MIKIIQLLKENPDMIQLLKENKLSLVGINEIEKTAILDAFEEDIKQKSGYWS